VLSGVFTWKKVIEMSYRVDWPTVTTYHRLEELEIGKWIADNCGTVGVNFSNFHKFHIQQEVGLSVAIGGKRNQGGRRIPRWNRNQLGVKRFQEIVTFELNGSGESLIGAVPISRNQGSCIASDFGTKWYTITSETRVVSMTNKATIGGLACQVRGSWLVAKITVFGWDCQT